MYRRFKRKYHTCVCLKLFEVPFFHFKIKKNQFCHRFCSDQRYVQQTTELYCDAGHRALYCIHHCARDWAQVSGTRVKDFHSKFFIDPTTGTCFCVEVYPNSNSCSYTLALILYNGVMTPACEPVPINPWEEDMSVKLEQEKMLFFISSL